MLSVTDPNAEKSDQKNGWMKGTDERNPLTTTWNQLRVKPWTGPTGSRIARATAGCIHWRGRRKWTERRALVFVVVVVVVVVVIVVFVVVVVVVLADEVAPSATVVRPRRRRRRGLGEEGQAEGGRGGALFAGGAAVGALSGADGLQHAALAFLQHVLLWRRRAEQGETWASADLQHTPAAVGVSSPTTDQTKPMRSPSS